MIYQVLIQHCKLFYNKYLIDVKSIETDKIGNKFYSTSLTGWQHFNNEKPNKYRH